MKNHFTIIFVFITVVVTLFGCTSSEDTTVPLKSISNFENTLKEYSSDNGYDISFIPSNKLDKDILTEGEIKLKDKGLIFFYLDVKGVIRVRLCIYEKAVFDKYLNEITILVNSFSKRQFSEKELNDFFNNDKYLVQNSTNNVHRYKEFGFFMDSSFNYLEEENMISLKIYTDIK